jgi:uncharacterized protein with FMN-binding domain
MQNRQQNSFVRGVKKFLLSAFVIVSFVGYALENRSAAGGSATPTAVTLKRAKAPSITAQSAPPALPETGSTNAAPGPANDAASAPATAPTTGPASNDTSSAPAAAPTDTPTSPAPTDTPTSPAPAVASNGLKDGTYTGPSVDVRWGNVQVQATIQKGQLSNVQFLDYPRDRRTSARINSIAGPELLQEAMQAQSANVDLITGATLTSEGFQESLQAALQSAQTQTNG